MSRFLHLLRVGVGVPNAAVAGCACLIAAQAPHAAMVAITTFGTLGLASGALALNQVQERDSDALMARTAGRPLPRAEIHPGTALAVALALIVCGALLLHATPGHAGLWPGLAALVAYNGIYTPLKRHTTLAIFPGALSGVAPLWIGWLAAGGLATAPALHVLSLFLFLWQLPHSWLILLQHPDDYRRCPQHAMYSLFGYSQIARLVVSWSLATAGCGLMLPWFGLLRHGVPVTGICLASLLLASAMLPLLRVHDPGQHSRRLVVRGYAAINLYAALVLVLVALDGSIAAGGLA
jgi:heme o synthase